MEADLQKSISDCAESLNPWNVFVELVPPDSELKTLPSFDKDTDVLLFFKLYDPKNKKIHYCGHHYMPVTAKVRKFKFHYLINKGKNFKKFFFEINFKEEEEAHK